MRLLEITPAAIVEVRKRFARHVVVSTIDITPPATISDLATSNLTSTAVDLDWGAVADADYYSVYRSADGAAFVKLTTDTAQTTTSYSETSLTSGVVYRWYVTATDSFTNESGPGNVVTETPPSALSWSQIPNFEVDDTYPNVISSVKTTYLSGSDANTVVTIHDGPGDTAVSSGIVSYDETADEITVTSDPGGQQVFMRATQDAAESDWLTRISGTGVVWYHDFRDDAEVDAFRWTGGYQNGNDPLSNGSVATGADRNSAWVRRTTLDGVTGGGCLESFRAAGSQEAAEWWRPLSAFQANGGSGLGNGRATDDPAANGSLTVQTWNPTDGGAQTAGWLLGTYAHPTEQTASASSYDGDTFYLQLRVKRDPRRLTVTNIESGKTIWLTTCPTSFSNQEVVTESFRLGSGNRFNMYGYFQITTEFRFEFDPGGATLQPGGTYGSVWNWPHGEWTTIEYKITMGRLGVDETRFEVWGSDPNDPTQPVKFWDQTMPKATGDGGWTDVNGFNALILSSYNNGGNSSSDFYERYDQVILSKEWIPWPQDGIT